MAWAIRFLPLWEEILFDHGDQLRSLMRKAVPNQQPRWVKGITFCLIANIMVRTEKEHFIRQVKFFVQLVQSCNPAIGIQQRHDIYRSLSIVSTKKNNNSILVLLIY